MRTNGIINRRITMIAAAVILLLMIDIAEAQYGHAHRATRRRTAVVVSTVTHEKDQEAAAQQQQDQEAAAQKEETATQEPAATQETSTGDHLPIGTVVTKLPEECEPLVVKDIQYYHCGNDYYRTAYQENNLVYVTTEKPQ